MEKLKRRKFITYLLWVVITGIVFISLSRCKGEKSVDNSKILIPVLSKENFLSVPDSEKLWVYYWWLKGNVSKESITHDLEAMKQKGIGGFLLFDSRGYHDDYYTGIIPVPLQIKLKFMSREWRDMVKHTMNEAARLGLQMSINLANTGGSLRGPWDLGQDGPKKLVWTSETIHGPAKISVALKTPENTRYYQDVAMLAVKLKTEQPSAIVGSFGDLNGKWNDVKEPGKEASLVERFENIRNASKDSQLQWNVPQGDWKILRFGFTVIADTGSVDILNKKAVERYFSLMGNELLKDAGPLAGKTLKYFYNVSWEGGEPNWTNGFEQEFLKFRGYTMENYMPVLAGMVVENNSVSMRFMHDYFRTVSDCFRENCYKTIGKLCSVKGIKWHSEDGGPWTRSAAMFKEADMLYFWGSNDIPQGEFWPQIVKGLSAKSNSRYTSMAAHIYGKPLSAIEAFTSMTTHYTEYPGYLKGFADKTLIDGSNMFIWHTFTASPPELGIPGYEYFAGTHLNPRVTWWDMSEGIINYIGRCQYLLRQGNFVADICSYVSDKNYITWGRGKKWNEKSTLHLNPGYKFDLLNTEVLVNRLSLKDGRLVLPDGMNYKLMVVDLEDQTIPAEALKKIIELAKNGASIVLGQNKPDRTSGLKDYPECDQEVVKMADELWGENNGKSTQLRFGKGMVIYGTSMMQVLKDKKILPDYEGPFEYIHRGSDKLDIYFLRGTGKAECTFRVNGKKPEIWDPVTGSVTNALSYHFTDDGRTVVSLNLPESGSVFVVFPGTKDNNYITSISEPEGGLEIKERKDDTLKLVLWKSGNYSLTDSRKKTSELNFDANSALELTGPWVVSFTPGRGAPEIATIKKLFLWNDSPDKGIKYFSGIATYKKVFNLTAEQAKDPARLELGQVFNIARVRINGKDLGVVWTDPWRVNIPNILKPGENKLEIEVANCWVNRLIGDAGLPEGKRYTRTNIRLLSERGKFNDYAVISATDSLRRSGLIGPVYIEFGKEHKIIF